MSPKDLKRDILSRFLLKRTLNIEGNHILHPIKEGQYIIRIPFGDDWSYTEVTSITEMCPRNWCRLDILVGKLIAQINLHKHMDKMFNALNKGL